MRHFRCEFGAAAAGEMHSLHFYGALGFAMVRNGGVGIAGSAMLISIDIFMNLVEK